MDKHEFIKEEKFFEKDEKDLNHKEQIICNLLDMDAQVCNGGFMQWVENGYIHNGGLTKTMNYLKEIGSETCGKVHKILQELSRYVDENDNHRRYWLEGTCSYCNGNEDEYCEYCDGTGYGTDTEQMDDEYYEIDKQFIQDITSWFYGKEFNGFTEEKTKPRVKLIGEDGNSFAIIGRVRKALRNAKMKEESDNFVKEATSNDYNGVLQAAMKYCEVY